MPNKWFANRGQIVQTTCVLVATGIAIMGAYPDLKDNHFFTVGAILAYVLTISVVISVWLVVRAIWLAARTPHTVPSPPQPAQAKSNVPDSPIDTQTYQHVSSESAKEHPYLSAIEEQMLMKASSAVRSLPWNQQVALQLVYRQPNLFMGQYCKQLTTLGFSESGKIIKHLMETILVSTDGRMNIGPSPHIVVLREVEKLLADTRNFGL